MQGLGNVEYSKCSFLQWFFPVCTGDNTAADVACAAASTAAAADSGAAATAAAAATVV